MSIIRATPIGCGAYLPEKVVTNDDLAKLVDTSDEWITTRSGIKRRHFAREDQSTSDLAVPAAREAMEMAGVSPDEIDLIVLATSTPDQTFPSTATRVQAALEIYNAAAFDVQAVCSGFIFALATANNFIRSGQSKTALVIGAETFSRILDWDDRSTCVLFGDGAGAVVLRAEEGEGAVSDSGILTTRLHSDGRHNRILYVDGGPSTSGHAGYVRMSGREVFKHAVTKLADVAHEAMDEIGVSGDDVDWIVPHQANIRIIESTAKKAGVPMEKVVVTVQEHGNTSAASIPLALTEAVRDGRIKKGDLLLMEAIGGGLAWGAAVMRW